jgi:dTDP-4-dehydrorhamnose 3,5-epimerase
MGRPIRGADPDRPDRLVIFTPTELNGVWLLDQERRADSRGYFARSFCSGEFAAHGLPTSFVQCNISYNMQRGTLRGMHWQADPYPEGKLVRCTRGAIFDVAVDLRNDSPTRHRWVGFELTVETGRSLYIPAGFGHGFQTLTDDAEVFYQMTENYQPGLARGARWDDQAFAIAWPLPDPILSDRDMSYPLLAAQPV